MTYSIFEEAKREALTYLMQKQWDLYLIKAWRERPFLPMAVCAGEFEKNIKMPPRQICAGFQFMKNHFTLTVSRFVAAFCRKQIMRCGTARPTKKSFPSWGKSIFDPMR